MAFSIHTNHRVLFLLPAGIYLVLVYLCAVWPAMQEQAATRRYCDAVLRCFRPRYCRARAQY